MPVIEKLSVGPIVGHVDVDTARVWGRAIYQKLSNGTLRRTFGIARIKEVGGRYQAPVFFKMNPNFDMSGIAIFQELEPDTTYVYQVGWFFSDKELDEFRFSERWDWKEADQGEFKTASNDNYSEKQFIFGSCRYLLRLLGGSWFDNRGDKTFRSILRQIQQGSPIDKFLMVGDQIYADDLNCFKPDEHVDQYFSRYRDVFSQQYIKELMSKVSTYMTLDDHEIEDNWPNKADSEDMMWKYPAAIHSYQTYQISHSPILSINEDGKLTGTPKKYYYIFKDGCCDFFVTDTRTERDHAVEEIISDTQLADLLNWLGDGSERVKFVVTSVPFFPDTRKENKDKWSGYKHQRDKIISYIRDNNVQKVVFLSGDVHCSMSAELDIGNSNSGSLKIYSIISSSFYWPYPHMKRRQFQLSGSVSSAENNSAYSLGHVTDVFSGDNFTRVSVSTDSIQVKVYERKGEEVSSVVYRF
ncbi:alkaline phosphatase D family protein [Photobacterium lutimaris]|uniref:Alkaline phosphatase n=1 Tax=Photobacterium lutimaris TaxID=388278 RepID=A0A2T3J0J2_9GAMM|nr:alkaline phosphatase D family protein [Photobacterium lutimaris]PSU34605.1 alkaline phosphatase [Photobacterium lutimaris]TDR71553.1 alkaline phosphatase D [Photobacterium lutimaris]